ncbi:hypothetical protein CROQUDRAFT_480091 [Cronartium quercuum f. sp. fusiforme G11]|uniref:Uncharacterized protein n=1 Tax=Cronartium quercuum f. sp. fusiforme G11 TaxID=708437 RepID=A0A9P6TDZ5_9BASI|nr:hypothetical protein CROQUDRAFT_480091 [Cronartium quercuum f. sp. fusiforme G11]
MGFDQPLLPSVPSATRLSNPRNLFAIGRTFYCTTASLVYRLARHSLARIIEVVINPLHALCDLHIAHHFHMFDYGIIIANHSPHTLHDLFGLSGLLKHIHLTMPQARTTRSDVYILFHVLPWNHQCETTIAPPVRLIWSLGFAETYPSYVVTSPNNPIRRIHPFPRSNVDS